MKESPLGMFMPVGLLAGLALLVWGGLQLFAHMAEGGNAFYLGLLVFAGGVFLVFSLGWMAWYQKHMGQHLQDEVARRTSDLEQTSRRFRLITDNAYDLVSIVSSDGKFEYSNSAYYRILGYTRDELREQNISRYIHPKDLDTFQRTLKEVATGKNAAEITFRMRHKKGSWVYLEAVSKGMHDADWSLTNIVIHCRDVTSKKKYADELARSEQRFRDFSESSADWLWEVDADMEFSYVSPGIKGVLGYASEEMTGQLKFDALFEKRNDPIRALIENRVNRHQPYRDIEFWTRSKAGERVCLRISAVPVFDEKQAFAGYRGAATNITTSKLDREHMFRLATTDHLTGLMNRSRFMEELDRTVSLAKRHKTRGVLLFIDLDQFKHINDSYGHEAGDVLLKSVAEVLKREVRSTDIVARLGGDEFGILMHKIDVDRARRKVQKIIDKVNGLNLTYQDHKLRVTMSIGMISYPQEDQDSTSLFMSADLAMYRAKDMGRNRMFVENDKNSFDATDSVKEQLKWVGILRKALETGNFEMHYQPIIPADKKEKPIFEALIRLRDDEGNIGAPYLFIDAAEHFGLIQQLDLSVIERCISTQVELRKKKIDVRMSINLSSRSLGDSGVVETLRKILKSYKIRPADFIFEVTETAAIHDPAAYRNLDEVKKFVDELRSMGFLFALDDFGVGFSSFNYIRSLNVDMLKIDGSYIRHLETSKEDQLFVRAIAELSKGMGIKTVAEFVEDEKILKELQKLGIDYAQGYHLSRPEADIEALYKNFNSKHVGDFIKGKKKGKKAA